MDNVFEKSDKERYSVDGTPIVGIDFRLNSHFIIGLLQGVHCTLHKSVLGADNKPMEVRLTILPEEPKRMIPHELFDELYRACKASFEFSDLAKRLESYF